MQNGQRQESVIVRAYLVDVLEAEVQQVVVQQALGPRLTHRLGCHHPKHESGNLSLPPPQPPPPPLPDLDDVTLIRSPAP